MKSTLGVQPPIFTEMAASDMEVTPILFQQYCVNGGFVLHRMNSHVLR